MSEPFSLDKLATLSNQELAQMARDAANRLTSQDWQRVMTDLKVSGHLHLAKDSAPPFLQRYLKSQIDLEEELGKQASFAPLLSGITLDPRRPRGDEERVSALLSTQDDGAHMRFEIQHGFDLTSVAFSVKAMLTLRFNLPRLDEDERYIFLDAMRRDKGVIFLWTPERWERDFLVFIRGEFFTRVFAFSPTTEATARLTSEAAGTLTDWLEKAWFPRSRRRQSKRITQALAGLNLPDVLKKPPAPPPQIPPTITPPSEEALQKVIQQLIHLDMSGRGALISVAGDKVEVLGRIFSAATQDHIVTEFHNHPDLFERVREKLTQISGDVTIDVKPVVASPTPPPPKDPDLDEW